MGGDGVLSSNPIRYLYRKLGQVMAASRVGVGEEGYVIVETGNLAALVVCSEVSLRGPLHDGLPYFTTEGLVGVGDCCQFCLQPFVGGVLLCLGLLVYVQGSADRVSYTRSICWIRRSVRSSWSQYRSYRCWISTCFCSCWCT
jgi:hypothetical protein